MKFFSVLNTEIGRRYLMLFLLVSLLPLSAMGWFAARSSQAALQEQTLAVLRAAADGAEAQLREYLTYLKRQLLTLAAQDEIRVGLELPVTTTAETLSPHENLSKLLVQQHEFLPEAQELFIVARNGRVVASSVPEGVGQDVSSTEYFRRGQTAFFPGDVFAEENTGRLSWIVAAPVRETTTRRLLGVVAFRIDPRTLSDLTTGRRVLAEGADTQSLRIGDTGETYVVNRAGLMITESRDIPDAILRLKVDTLPVRIALAQGQEVTANYRDYHGRYVSGASFILRDLGWVVVTEIDFSQAFAPIKQFRRGMIEFGAGLSLLVVFLAWSSTRRITHPLQILAESERALAQGNVRVAIAPEDNLPDDEIGGLVRARNARVKALLENQKQLEERTLKLRDALAELDHMSYSIVHDMRAPLRAISGFGDLVLADEGERLSAEGRNHLARMQAATLRMDQLIRDLLNYSGIVRGELPLHPVNVSKLVRDIVETYPLLEPFKTKIAVPPELPPVLGNEAGLTQSISNLLENAVKFLDPGRVPEIKVTGERIGDRVRIWVEDNGVGIHRHLQERIFDIFHRGTNEQEGTGIGLAIVRKTVERMGGRVGVISEPGYGSRFWIELQSAEATQQ